MSLSCVCSGPPSCLETRELERGLEYLGVPLRSVTAPVGQLSPAGPWTCFSFKRDNAGLLLARWPPSDAPLAALSRILVLEFGIPSFRIPFIKPFLPKGFPCPSSQRERWPQPVFQPTSRAVIIAPQTKGDERAMNTTQSPTTPCS